MVVRGSDKPFLVYWACMWGCSCRSASGLLARMGSIPWNMIFVAISGFYVHRGEHRASWGVLVVCWKSLFSFAGSAQDGLTTSKLVELRISVLWIRWDIAC